MCSSFLPSCGEHSRCLVVRTPPICNSPRFADIKKGACDPCGSSKLTCDARECLGTAKTARRRAPLKTECDAGRKASVAASEHASSNKSIQCPGMLANAARTPVTRGRFGWALQTVGIPRPLGALHALDLSIFQVKCKKVETIFGLVGTES